MNETCSDQVRDPDQQYEQTLVDDDSQDFNYEYEGDERRSLHPRKSVVKTPQIPLAELDVLP